VKHISKLLVIILLSLLSTGKIFPQDSLLSKPEIKNYIQFLEKENGKLSLKELKNKQIDYIKQIASLRYQAYDKDYIGMFRFMKSRKGLGGATLQAINKMLGEKVCTLIQASYLLEMKINSINNVQYKHDGTISYKVEISASILDVLKGKNKFNLGDSIIFYYDSDIRWTNYNFKLGETVFAGFLTGEDNVMGINNALLYGNDMNGEDASYGRYPIENGILIDRNNVWGYGRSVPWKEFKMKITQDINNIISGR
jgi:hypothetical protein